MSKKGCENSKKMIRYVAKPPPKDLRVATKINDNELSDTDDSIQSEPQIKEKSIDEVSLDIPMKNFSKCIEKRMSKIESLEIKKLKSHSDLSKDERATFNERITRNILNFPFDKKLYKELISLQLNDKPTIPVLQSISANYEPSIRDQVPKLEDFYTPKQKTEFNIPIISTIGSHSIIRNYDGLRMHKLMCTWKNEKFS